MGFQFLHNAVSKIGYPLYFHLRHLFLSGVLQVKKLKYIYLRLKKIHKYIIYEANYQVLKPLNFFVTVFSNLMAVRWWQKLNNSAKTYIVTNL